MAKSKVIVKKRLTKTVLVKFILLIRSINLVFYDVVLRQLSSCVVVMSGKREKLKFR